ncbi:hypothetical protein ACFY7C_18070 [Streptomyces sp. NPDC012769]|uniref:hypothetical protein n=1 Tax=Streptomyces sp. NPDC012769 TaxID=3364848 RepID=UPI0036CA77EE
MSDLDRVEPRIRRMLESRKLFLRRPVPGDGSTSPDMVHVIWDPDGDGYGVPVGHVLKRTNRRGMLGRTEERWDARARLDPGSAAAPEIATALPDINRALEAVLAFLPSRYS